MYIDHYEHDDLNLAEQYAIQPRKPGCLLPNSYSVAPVWKGSGNIEPTGLRGVCNYTFHE